MLSVLIGCATALFAGCSSEVTVTFSTEEINLCVGESRDVLPYIIFEPAVGGGKVELSADGDCVNVVGTRVYALKSGEAVVTANGTAKLKINIAYRESNAIELAVDGATVQNIGDGSAKPQAVKFTAALPEYADPNTEIVYEVNGKRAATGATFEFEPTGCGLFAVTARAGKGCASCDVYVYRQTESAAKYSGKLVQAGDFSPVTFTVYENIWAHNPRSFVQWKVNGDVKGSGGTFVFTPRFAGEYKITYDINGVRGAFVGGGAVTVTAAGDRAPSVSEIAIGEKVKIKWSDGEHISSVSITSPDGSRDVYNRFDSRYAHRFSRGEFDATGLIAVCAAEPSVYTVWLTADGRGEPYEFRQYPLSAAEYIGNKVFCFDSLITDCEKARSFVTDMYVCGRTEAKAYVAHGYDTERAAAAIAEAANMLGISLQSVKSDGQTLSVELGEYDNAPVRNGTSRSVRVSAFLPHVEYDSAARRDQRSYVFALDRVSAEVSVENTEQLLWAALCGVKPVPVAGSKAAEVYARCKSALISIIGADYSEFRKVHAIYDFLQWVTLRADGNAEGAASSADYLDGVFLSPADERRTYGAVSSMGAAKAFLLMCKTEGIDCELAVRDDGEYYNRVVIDGMIYNVDVYGGKKILSPGGTVAREMCSHKGLFVTDEALGAENDEPASDAGKSYYTQKQTGGGICFDMYFDGSETESEIYSAVSVILGAAPRGNVTVYNIYGHEDIPVTAWGIELAAKGDNTVSEITSAIVEYCKKTFGNMFSESAVTVYSESEIRHITIIVPHTAEAARLYENYL